jgi:hypothetical protein
MHRASASEPSNANGTMNQVDIGATMAQYCGYCGAQVQAEGSFCHVCGKSKVPVPSSATPVACASVPAATSERIFLRNETVTVTDTRFIVPGQTYAIAGVTSVRFERINPNIMPPILFFVLGASLLIISETRIVGVLVMLIAGLWLASLKPTFAVALHSASGEARAITSKDERFISSIVEALNQAIVYRR